MNSCILQSRSGVSVKPRYGGRKDGDPGEVAKFSVDCQLVRSHLPEVATFSVDCQLVRSHLPEVATFSEDC